MNRQKGFTLIPLLVLVLLLSVGVYLYSTHKIAPPGCRWNQVQCIKAPCDPILTCAPPTPSPSASQVSNGNLETTNWKTYKDNIYSFQYPSVWEVEGGYSDFFEGQVVTIKNPSQTIRILISPGQYPYGFEGPKEIKQKPLELTINNNEYRAKENIISNRSAYVDIALNNNENEYHILFGTGYPTGSRKESLSDYLSSKETIIKILSTFRFD